LLRRVVLLDAVAAALTLSTGAAEYGPGDPSPRVQDDRISPPLSHFHAAPHHLVLLPSEIYFQPSAWLWVIEKYASGA
jgi:hypothetical protein